MSKDIVSLIILLPLSVQFKYLEHIRQTVEQKNEMFQTFEIFKSSVLQEKLYWLDKLEDTFCTNIRRALISEHKEWFQMYDHVNTSSIVEKEKQIILCRNSTCRLEHLLDFVLENIDGKIFFMSMYVL